MHCEHRDLSDFFKITLHIWLFQASEDKWTEPAGCQCSWFFKSQGLVQGHLKEKKNHIMTRGCFPVTQDWALFVTALFHWLSLSVGPIWKIKSILILLGMGWCKGWLCSYWWLTALLSGSGQPWLGSCAPLCSCFSKDPVCVSVCSCPCVWQVKELSRSCSASVPVSHCLCSWLGFFPSPFHVF